MSAINLLYSTTFSGLTFVHSCLTAFTFIHINLYLALKTEDKTTLFLLILAAAYSTLSQVLLKILWHWVRCDVLFDCLTDADPCKSKIVPIKLYRILVYGFAKHIMRLIVAYLIGNMLRLPAFFL